MSRTKITCPVDGLGNCFQERLPEGDTYMSFDCGYASNEHYKIGSEAVENVLSKAPQLIQELAFDDNARGIVWIPSVVQIPNKGIVFPDGTSKDQWGYRFAAEIEIPEEEQKDWPIEGKDGEFYKARLDMDNSTPYESWQFSDAIANLGLVLDNVAETSTTGV
tara:strand:+ start:926 stop:1414 length:489 start_codon:yes stop_codon:yes gene_type:complete